MNEIESLILIVLAAMGLPDLCRRLGMPALVYRWYFGAHGLKGLERNILAFCGIRPIRESLIGSVESKNPSHREKWLARMRALGAEGK